MRSLTTILVILFSLTTVAQAQWKVNESIDPFTDQKLITVINDGQIVSGTKKPTSLILRIKDNKQEIYWVTPDPYICDIGNSIKVRYGDDEPESLFVTPSTSKDTLFFKLTFSELWKMTQTDKIRLLLQDECGSQIVAQFNGSIKPYLPKIQKLQNLKPWKIENGGFISKTDASLSFRYRPHGYSIDFKGVELQFTEKSEPHDFVFTVNGSEAAKSGNQREKVRLIVGNDEFTASAFKVEQSGSRTGKVEITIPDQIDVEEFINKVLQNPNVTLTLKNETHSISLNLFGEAVKVFNPEL